MPSWHPPVRPWAALAGWRATHRCQVTGQPAGISLTGDRGRARGAKALAGAEIFQDRGRLSRAVREPPSRRLSAPSSDLVATGLALGGVRVTRRGLPTREGLDEAVEAGAVARHAPEPRSAIPRTGPVVAVEHDAAQVTPRTGWSSGARISWSAHLPSMRYHT